MIEYASGDILRSDADAVVNTVNCVGVMGRGIALQFKNAYPANFKAYAAACKRGEVQPGRMFVVETGQLSPRFIINFPTKRHWRGKSRMEDIEAGLLDLLRVIERFGITSIAIPPLGAGLGGLDWSAVRTRIESAMASVPSSVRVVVYEPVGAPPAASMVHARQAPKMTPGRAALVEMMRDYLNGLLDPFVTLIEVHKLMYFLQEANEDLKLRFSKATYGPYAENLRHVLKDIEGHLISGYADGGDQPFKPLTLLPGASDAAAALLADHPDSATRMTKVRELLDGFESPFGLELLATVHWVATREAVRADAGIIDAVYAWNDRKKQFTPRQIELAHERLAAQGWLPALTHARA